MLFSFNVCISWFHFFVDVLICNDSGFKRTIIFCRKFNCHFKQKIWQLHDNYRVHFFANLSPFLFFTFLFFSFLYFLFCFISLQDFDYRVYWSIRDISHFVRNIDYLGVWISSCCDIKLFRRPDEHFLFYILVKNNCFNKGI